MLPEGMEGKAVNLKIIYYRSPKAFELFLTKDSNIVTMSRVDYPEDAPRYILHFSGPIVDIEIDSPALMNAERRPPL